MQISSPEIKVGAFTIIALIAIFGLSLWLNGSQVFQRGYDVEALFSRVDGLRPGAPVKFAGVDIGRVTKVYFEDLNVIVGMRIVPDFKVPPAAKAIIASSGVVGDTFIEIIPPHPGETFIPRKDQRLVGQTPVTMEQFSATAYGLLDSLGQIANSIKSITDDPEIMSSLKKSIIRLNTITSDIELVAKQFRQTDFVQLFQRVDHTMKIVEQMAVDNEPHITKLIENITQASVQLTQASITANQFLKSVDNNGKTAADLQETLSQAKKIADNLEKFTAILADNSKNITPLMHDAQQTLQSINQAAQNINQGVSDLTSGDNNLTNLKKIIADTGKTVEQVSQSVNNLAQISIKNRIGLEYQWQQTMMADYMMDMSFNEQNSLLIGLEDIGGSNLATLQWGFKAPKQIGRVGLYKNQFGVGLDYKPMPGLALGVDLWNTHSPNAGLSSTFTITPNWSLMLSGSDNLNSQTFMWSIESWHSF